MSDTMLAQGPAADTPAQASQVQGQEGSGSLLTGSTPDQTATPATSAPAAPPSTDGQDKGSASAQPAALPGWASAVTKELRADERFQNLASKYKSLDEYAKAHIALEAKLGNSVQIPGEKATDEERASFHARLGVPKDPKDYVLEQPELPAGLEYDQTVAEGYRKVASDLHLTADQAKALYAWNNERTLSAFKAQQDAAAEAQAVARADQRRAVEATVKELRSQWGSGFDTELSRATRLVTEMDARIPGLKADLERTGFGNSRSGIMLLHTIASQFADHRMVEGEGSSGVVDAARAMFGGSMSS